MFAVIIIFIFEAIGFLIFILSVYGIFFPAENAGARGIEDLGYFAWLAISIIIMFVSTIAGIMRGIIGGRKHPEQKKYKILLRTSYLLIIITLVSFIVMLRN